MFLPPVKIPSILTQPKPNKHSHIYPRLTLIMFSQHTHLLCNLYQFLRLNEQLPTINFVRRPPVKYFSRVKYFPPASPTMFLFWLARRRVTRRLVCDVITLGTNTRPTQQSTNPWYFRVVFCIRKAFGIF